MNTYQRLVLLLFPILLSSCGAYDYSVLFKIKNIDLPESKEKFNKAYKSVSTAAEKNYEIRKFDRLGVRFFTNKGEPLSDPNGEFPQRENPYQSVQMQTPTGGGVSGVGAAQGAGGAAGGGIGGGGALNAIGYLVNEDGTSRLPLIGNVRVQGLKIYQLDSMLSAKYDSFYEGAFVQTRVINHRIVLVGALGSRIIPLDNEDMNLIEVLAMAGNVDFRTRTDRIRIIRNPLNNPQVQFVDLTTWEGVKAANLKIEPNDIIYLEPRRRIARNEGVSDIASIIGTFASIISSTATLILLFNVLK